MKYRPYDLCVDPLGNVRGYFSGAVVRYLSDTERAAAERALDL